MHWHNEVFWSKLMDPKVQITKGSFERTEAVRKDMIALNFSKISQSNKKGCNRPQIGRIKSCTVKL